MKYEIIVDENGRKMKIPKRNTKKEKCPYCNHLIRYEHSKYCTNCSQKIFNIVLNKYLRKDGL